MITDAVPTGVNEYQLFERTAKCETCQHEQTVELTGRAYRLDDAPDLIYWYAVEGQTCPACGQKAAGVSQPIAEIEALGLRMWRLDENNKPVREVLY